jgi:hypothetical protein
VEELELGINFNQELNNLPNSIKKIIFNKQSKYNKELNCLPKFVEILQLPIYYNKRILKLPSAIKKIICSKKHKYIGDIYGCQIEIYNNY